MYLHNIIIKIIIVIVIKIHEFPEKFCPSYDLMIINYIKWVTYYFLVIIVHLVITQENIKSVFWD